MDAADSGGTENKNIFLLTAPQPSIAATGI